MLAAFTACVPQLTFPPFNDLTPAIVISPQPVPAGFNQTPIFKSGFVFEGIAGRVGHHASTIASLSDGSLLAAWYSYSNPDNELEGSGIFMARLPAGAEEWTAPQAHVDRPEGDGNPVLYAEGDEVWLFQAIIPFGWSTARVVFQRSSDGGETWSGAQPLNGPLGCNVRNPPIRLETGELMLPAYEDLFVRSLFFVSDDGWNWRLVSSVYTDPPLRNLQPAVLQRDDGALLAFMRNDGRGWLWAAESEDGGRSWSPPLDSGFGNPGKAVAALRAKSGNWILVLNDTEAELAPLSMTLSMDEGRTWNPSKPLIDGNGAYIYPAVAQTADGLIHVLYTHDRQKIGHATVNEAWLFE